MATDSRPGDDPGAMLKALVWIVVIVVVVKLLTPASAPSPMPAVASPRSVIVLIGDGMGPQEIGLSLDVSDALGEETVWTRAFAQAHLSLVRTGAHGTPVTDSAASATAIATGVATVNKAIGVDPQGAELITCADDALATGRRLGVVTSTRLTHATPASFLAHVPLRSQENEIARQALESGADVLLGGGAKHFLGGIGGQVIADEIRAAGYQLVRTKEELAAATTPVLGLFASDNLPYVVDRDGDAGEPWGVPTLAELTSAALERLDGPEGFFLVVEGGRIDHAGHENDAGTLVGEMREFEETLAVLLDFLDDHPETALIVTADHETGGLCLTYREGDFPAAEHLRALAKTERSAKLLAGKETMSEDEARELFGSLRLSFVPEWSWVRNNIGQARSAESYVSFGSQGHSATPITLLQLGVGERLPQLSTHMDLGQQLREWLQTPVTEGKR